MHAPLIRFSLLSKISAASLALAAFLGSWGYSQKEDSIVSQGAVYDVVVYGATPGGIACAVRLAREGKEVLLVTYNDRIGGMLTSGLGVWDTLYEGYRSPIYNELRQSIFDYYRVTYGEGSQVYKDALPGETGHNNGTFEAHVAEELVNDMVAAEANIAVLYGNYPVAITMNGTSMQSITFKEMEGKATNSVTADFFADCSYEGDLMAIAGVPYRVGREAQNEYQEKHAGVIYMLPVKERNELSEREIELFDRLNIRHFGTDQSIIYPDSTHEADTKVQAFNMRYYITNDPTNQIEVEPSNNYDPDYLKTLEFQTPGNVIKPNNKLGVNRPQLVGLHNEYVEGDWAKRRSVVDEHVRITRDLIYFMKHDPAAPVNMRRLWQDWSLAKDEFVDNNNNPYEIYVREARRLIGPYIYTENDLSLQDDYDRARLHPDSIGIVEWYMDAHACTWRKSPQGGLHEGKMMLHKETFVGQFPYRCILTKEIDNLLVPVCASLSHVAWGAYRLEPTWMQIGESSAYAILQASEYNKKLAEIDTERLLRTLAQKRSLITFFNDFTIDGSAEWIAAIQYFGTKGFFHEYEAHPQEIVSESTLTAWVNSLPAIQSGKHKAEVLIRQLATEKSSPDATMRTLKDLLRKRSLPIPEALRNKQTNQPITRAIACQHLFEILNTHLGPLP